MERIQPGLGMAIDGGESMTTTLWRAYQERWASLSRDLGSCRCISSTVGKWLRIRLGNEWLVATHHVPTQYEITLIRLDSPGISWQVRTAPFRDRGWGPAVAWQVGVSRNMRKARAHSEELQRQLNEEY